MPKDITLYTVFVASPGDVNTERLAVKKIVDEINLTTADILQIKLELKRWETDVYPDLGESTQDVINNQIEDDYDIFIGIMWSKFGTPTKIAGSGTEEEFNRSYEKWKNSGGKIKVMFYFKKEGIPIDKIIPEQITAINKFKESLAGKGLYRDFNDSDDFEQLLRIQLNKALADLVSTKKILPHSTTELVEKATIEINDEAEEELGLFENIEMVQNNFEQCRKILENITRYLTELTENVNGKADQIKKLASASNEVKIREQKRIIDNTAGDMMNFVNRTNVEIPIFKQLYESGVKALSNAYSISNAISQQSSDDINDMRSGIISLKNGLNVGIDGMTSFKIVIENTPNYTNAYNKAKKETLRTLQNILKEFRFALQLAEEFEKDIPNPPTKL